MDHDGRSVMFTASQFDWLERVFEYLDALSLGNAEVSDAALPPPPRPPPTPAVVRSSTSADPSRVAVPVAVPPLLTVVQATCRDWRHCLAQQRPSAWARLCKLKWRWWAAHDSQLSFDGGRSRTGSIDMAMSAARGSGSGASGGGGGGGGAAQPSSPKRAALGRVDTVGPRVPLKFPDAKYEYVRRCNVDRAVAVHFRLVQRARFHMPARARLMDAGTEAKDVLTRYVSDCDDLTRRYFAEGVLRDINEVTMVHHVSVCAAVPRCRRLLRVTSAASACVSVPLCCSFRSCSRMMPSTTWRSVNVPLSHLVCCRVVVPRVDDGGGGVESGRGHPYQSVGEARCVCRSHARRSHARELRCTADASCAWRRLGQQIWTCFSCVATSLALWRACGTRCRRRVCWASTTASSCTTRRADTRC
jgi:hypothetical protein